MEPITGALFISTAIIAITQAIKDLAPRVHGAVTLAVSLVIGILAALLDVAIGIPDITIAQGIMYALAGSGVVTVAKKI